MTKLISFLITVILTAISLEAALNLIDPLGIRLNFHGQTRMAWVMVEDISGYRVLEGDYYFSSQTRILADGSRFVPNANENASCSLVILGDSFAFGWGVSDAETFANLIASHYDSQVMNTARSGYNAGNIEKLYEMYAADAYLWLITPNDVNIAWSTTWQGRSNQAYAPATWLYWEYLRPHDHYYLAEDRPTYNRVLARLGGDSHVLLVGYEHDPNFQLL